MKLSIILFVMLIAFPLNAVIVVEGNTHSSPFELNNDLWVQTIDIHKVLVGNLSTNVAGIQDSFIPTKTDSSNASVNLYMADTVKWLNGFPVLSGHVEMFTSQDKKAIVDKLVHKFHLKSQRLLNNYVTLQKDLILSVLIEYNSFGEREKIELKSYIPEAQQSAVLFSIESVWPKKLSLFTNHSSNLKLSVRKKKKDATQNQVKSIIDSWSSQSSMNK